MAYAEIFGLLLFVTFIFHLIKRPRIGLNEPPLVPYQYPIIGHTYSLLYDSENFLKECKEKYGEPFSLYVFGTVRTYTGVDSNPEVLRHSDVFDFGVGTNKKLLLAEIFETFMDNYSPSNMARVVHDQVSGKISVYTSRIEKELLYGIEEFIGDCNGIEGAQFEDLIVSFTVVESELHKMKFVPLFLLFIHPSFYKFFATLPLKFGWNPITQHRDLFIQRCKPIIEERIRQRKELGEKYIQKEDILDFHISESKTDVVDDRLLNNLFGALYMIVFASISTTTRATSFALYDYGGRPELWNELYEEQLKIHNECNGNLSSEYINTWE
ncbi:21452_t:CDS:2 [Gigaspora rosea]|nr:21452_t:CDS:2 [Gigaspora rosea]